MPILTKFGAAGQSRTCPAYTSIRALLNTGINQKFNASRRGKRLFAPTQIHASVQQHPIFYAPTASFAAYRTSAVIW